jgi:mannose-6-phosphate isomerase-like protein (cupin superfamily)
MEIQPLNIIDIAALADANKQEYHNFVLTHINDQVIRMSVMTTPYHWHYHPDSDESFLVIAGSLIIELENQTIELLQGQLFTIPKNIKHCTRPGGERSVNLTFESAGLTTVSAPFSS